MGCCRYSVCILESSQRVYPYLLLWVLVTYLINTIRLSNNICFNFLNIENSDCAIIAGRYQESISNIFKTSYHIFMFINLSNQITFRLLYFFHFNRFTVIIPKFESLLDIELLKSIQCLHYQIYALTYSYFVCFVLFYEPCQQFLEIWICIRLIDYSQLYKEKWKSLFSNMPLGYLQEKGYSFFLKPRLIIRMPFSSILLFGLVWMVI